MRAFILMAAAADEIGEEVSMEVSNQDGTTKKPSDETQGAAAGTDVASSSSSQGKSRLTPPSLRFRASLEIPFIRGIFIFSKQISSFSPWIILAARASLSP